MPTPTSTACAHPTTHATRCTTSNAAAKVHAAVGATGTQDEGVEPPRMNEIAELLQAVGCRSTRRVVAGKKATVWNGVTIATDARYVPADQDRY